MYGIFLKGRGVYLKEGPDRASLESLAAREGYRFVTAGDSRSEMANLLSIQASARGYSPFDESTPPEPSPAPTPDAPSR